MINGSYWFGSILGSASALFFLSGIFPVDLGWRLAFGVGAVIGLSAMFVRRKVPESPRWLFIHGREDEAEAIVAQVEDDVRADTGQDLAEVGKSITVRQRTTVPFQEIARVAYKLYPRRAVLCLALFVGQAFIYNGITFNLGTLMTTFYKISSAAVPVFIIIYAAGNLAGPLVLGRLFDTVGRKPMISGTYLGSALLSVVLAGLFVTSSLTIATFIIVVVAVFFLASAGASAAYLTASEIFPMETRALAIAFFYAIGTAVGGITGPLLFGSLISTGAKGDVAIGFLIGGGVMAVGGVAELLFGVRAAGRQLEDVATPLTAGDDETAEARPGERPGVRNGPAARLAAGDRAGDCARALAQDLRELERAVLRRYRPGPGSISSSHGWAVTMPDSSRTLDQEVRAIERALDEHGPTQRRALAQLAGSRYWGPGVFGAALRETLAAGQVRSVSRSTFALAGRCDDSPGEPDSSRPGRG